MWLVFLRFDDQGEAVTTHIRAADINAVDNIVKHAQQHGFTATAKLVDYIGFSASGTIKPGRPNPKVLEHSEFLRKWEAASPTTHQSGNE